MNTTTTSADRIVRRRLAVEFLGKGVSPADVALVIGVSRSSVKHWKKAFRPGGAAALEPKPNPGLSTKLISPQWERLRQLLLDGPRAAGLLTELWTCARVSYHPTTWPHLARPWFQFPEIATPPPPSGTKRQSSAGARMPGRTLKKAK